MYGKKRVLLKKCDKEEKLMTKFIVITDTHFFKNSLGCSGKIYDNYMKTQQKCYAETEAINEAVFDFLSKTDLADTIFIAGDLVNDGDKQSHLAFIKLLEKVQAAGKKIYIITAGHDHNKNPRGYLGEERFDLEPTQREELYELYKDFGFSSALTLDKENLTYTANIGDDVRLLALNCDGKGEKNGTFDEERMLWIENECKKAKEDGRIAIGMNHIPLLAGQPIFSLVKNAVQKNASEITTRFADFGLNLVFTGHMHNQSINCKTTELGNKFYDICTGAVVQAPACMRLVSVIDNETIDIKTLPCPDFDYPMGDKTCEQYLNDIFDASILNMISDLKDSPEILIKKCGATPNKALCAVFSKVGRVIDTMKVGTVCKLAFVKCDASVKDKPFKDLAAEIVRSLFQGNQRFKEGTVEGDILLNIIKRFNFVLKKLNIKNTDGEKVDLFEVIKNTIGNYGIDDNNAVIKLK